VLDRNSSETTPTEAPIAYRCWWTLTTNVPPFKCKPECMEFSTKGQAEQKHADLLAQFGGQIAACVVPVFRRPPDPTSKAAKLRAIEAAGWPVHLSPKAAERRSRKGG
jgi:hypothetical protein